MLFLWNSASLFLEDRLMLNNTCSLGTWDILEARGHPLYYYSDNQPRMEMVYQFVIRRRPLFYTVNLLIPTCLVTFLTVELLSFDVKSYSCLISIGSVAYLQCIRAYEL